MTSHTERAAIAAATRLFREMLGAGIIYAAAVFCASWAIENIEIPRWGAALLAVAPIAPALLMLRAQLRHMRTLDEFQQRLQGEAVLIAAAIIAFGTLAYGQLEDMAGFPDISLMFVFPALCVAWAIASVALHLRYK